MISDKTMSRRISRALWECCQELGEEDYAGDLQMLLLVCGLGPDGQQMVTFRGLFGDQARMVDALRAVIQALENGEAVPAPEMEQEEN